MRFAFPSGSVRGSFIPGKYSGRETTAVRVDPSDFESFDAFIRAERFALYLLPGETVDDVRREIANLAATLPLATAIRESADRLRRMIGAGATGIHVRRMDLTGVRQRSESMLSYVPDGYIDAVVLDSPPDRKFVVCGDDPEIGRRVERLRPGGVIRPAKLLADAPLDSRQKAFVDLLSLAACERIHAGRGAFSSVAALMGNATLLDFRRDAQTANRPPAADPLTASFFFFDRGGRALADGDAAAACAAFEMATAFDPRNFCCQLDQVRGWALAGDRRFEAAAANAQR
jgi:hypothetical protein